MTKQCEAKVTLVNGRDTSSLRAIGGHIAAAYTHNKLDLIGPAIIETAMTGNVVCDNVELEVMDLMGAFGQTGKAASFPLRPGFSVISLVTGHAPAADDGRLI